MTEQNDCPFTEEQIAWLKCNLGIRLRRGYGEELQVALTLCDEDIDYSWCYIVDNAI